MRRVRRGENRRGDGGGERAGRRSPGPGGAVEGEPPGPVSTRRAAMHVRPLGTAAGGGVPQWNCNCATCREARAGRGRVLPRSQSSVAVSADDQHWFLLNASPDIRWQIEAFPPLQPLAGKKRSSPIQSVLLTNA